LGIPSFNLLNLKKYF